MRVAAYQMPLSACHSAEAVHRISSSVRWCESNGVQVLCCPEGAIGGLADYCDDPSRIALRVDDGELLTMLAPVASELVTAIVGFTERGADGRLFNSAAILNGGKVIGVYRKLHPAINRSVYSPGYERPVFRVGRLTFGTLLCRDSTFSEPALTMAAKDASVLFVPTNTGLPAGKAGSKLLIETHACDVLRAKESVTTIVRADVVGSFGKLAAYGTSAITKADGSQVRTTSACDGEEILVHAVVER